MREITNCKNFWQCLKSIQFTLLILPFMASAQIKRAPANYVPDDDMILLPIVVERNYFEEFNEKHKDKFDQANQKLKTWMAQEQYAQDYGMDRSMVNLPTESEKQRFLERNYLRFLSKDIEKSTNKSLQETLQEWNADDELAANENQELNEQYLIRAKKQTGQTANSSQKIEKTVKIGKKKLFKLDIQPRLEMGMVKISFKSSIVNFRAWLGINGNQEVRFERKIKTTKTKTQLNYYIEEKRVLASIDQSIVKNVSLRLTHDRYIEGIPGSVDNASVEDNKVQLRFGMRF